MQRINYPDVIYRTEHEKYNAIADEIERLHKWDVLELEGRQASRRARSSSETDDAIDVRAARRQKQAKRSIARGSKCNRSSARPADPGRHRVDRKERAAVGDARQARRQARGAQRQASQREAEIVAQAGRQERGDHRHEHGRPRHRHHPRRQSRDDGLGHAAGQVRDAARRAARRMERAGRRDRSSART